MRRRFLLGSGEVLRLIMFQNLHWLPGIMKRNLTNSEHFGATRPWGRRPPQRNLAFPHVLDNLFERGKSRRESRLADV